MINIAELLKDCPQGMELDCTMYDNVTLDSVSTAIDYPIKIVTKNGFSTKLTQYGQNVGIEEGKCVIFPKGKTTWEGFVPPCKFKVGDRVIRKATHETYIIGNITSSGYVFKKEGGTGFIFKDEHIYELAPNKFDITTLKSFDKVLVRDFNDDYWIAANFSHYTKGEEGCYTYFASGSIFEQCIPYEGNEHLLGKTDDCDEFYKTWEL